MKHPTSTIETSGTFDLVGQPGLVIHATNGAAALTFSGRIGVQILNSVIAEATKLRDDLQAAL